MDSNRLNLMGLTIDPPHAKDLDDAIWVQKREGGYSLQVCIADVASEVRIGTPVDLAARKLGFTRYGEDTKHMLSEPLANDKLSLLPGKERRVFAVAIWVSDAFEVRLSRLSCATLKSQAKLSYLEVDTILADSSHELHSQLSLCYKLASGLLAKRRRDGAIAIHDEANKWTMTEEGNLRELIHDEAHKSHIIVQEFMILTNHLVAAKLSKEGVPTLFRNHQAKPACPDRAVLLSDLGGAFTSLNPGQIEQARERTRLILERAVYAPTLHGHFGLNVSAYTHFTSPIRRYADLVVQRMLRAFLEKQDLPYSQDQLVIIGSEMTAVQHRLKDESLIPGKRPPVIVPVEKKEELVIAVPVAPAEQPLSTMNPHTFRKVVAGYLTIKVPRRDLIHELSARLRANKLVSPDFYPLLVIASGAESKAWAGIKTQILRWFSERPFEAVGAMNVAVSKKEDFVNYSLEARKISGTSRFKATASVLFGKQLLVASGEGASKKSAEQKAIVLLWKEIVATTQSVSDLRLDVPLPKPSANGASGSVPAPKPAPFVDHISKLSLLCRKQRWSMPEFSSKLVQIKGQEGLNYHLTTAKVKLANGTLVTAKSREMIPRKRDAEQDAARALLEQLQQFARMKNELSGTWTIAAEAGNFVSALQELCAARKVALPAYEVVPNEPPAPGSKCVCRVVFGDKVLRHEATATSKKLAKQSASKLVYSAMVEVRKEELVA